MPIAINGTTGISGVDGSASAPAVTGTDSNTGINFGSDTVNINTGGTTRATVDSSGNLTVNEGNLNVSKPAIPTVLVQNSTDTSFSTVKLQQSSGSGGSFSISKLGTNSSATGGANAAQLWQSAAAPIVFATNNTERMRITSVGYLKASANGASTGSNATHVLSNSNASNYATQFFQTASNGYGLSIDVNSNLSSREGLSLYSTTDSTQKAAIMMNGNFYSRSNSYGAFSDQKLKENIVDATSQWNDLKAVKVRNFNFISDTSNTKLLGVVAQELETVCPSLIETTPDKEINEQGERVETGTSTKSVKYSILYMKAIKALQEAIAKIETLETKVAALEAG